MAIEMTTATLTRTDLLATVSTIPACMHTNYQRVGYMLSVLRSHANGLIAQAATSLYDGSISQMARRNATSTPEAVVDAVLARAHAGLDALEQEMAAEERQEAAREECAQMNEEFTLEYRMRQREQGMLADDHPDDIVAWAEGLLAGKDTGEMAFTFGPEPVVLSAAERFFSDTLDVLGVAGLLERCWDADLDPVGLPTKLFPDTSRFSAACEAGQHHRCRMAGCACGCHLDYDPTPAAAVVLDFSAYDRWEQEQTCRMDAVTLGLDVLSEATLEEVEQGDDWDCCWDEWEAFQRDRAYRVAKVAA